MSLGNDLIKTALSVSAITTLVDTYLTKAAIWNANISPNGYTGNKYILFYVTDPHDPNLGYGRYGYTINCRSDTFDSSITLALEVKDVINRVAVTDGFMTCTILQTLPPSDDTDVYNTPVAVILKTRSVL